MAKEKTGYPSIDKPWLESYDENAYENALNSPKDKTIWQVYKPIMEGYGDKPIIRYFNKTFTGKEYIELIEQWAKTFRAMEIEPDEMVPVYGTWSPDIAAMFFALNAVGAHPYFEKLDITPDALEKETAGAKVAVVHETLWGAVQEVFRQERFNNIIVSSLADNTNVPLRYVLGAKSFVDSIKGHSTIPRDPKFISATEARNIGRYFSGEYEVPFKQNRIASITSSSGTSSSMVKGIMDTNESILANVYGTSLAEPNYQAGKNLVVTLPPTASTALNCMYLLPIFRNMTVTLDPRASEDDWFNVVTSSKASVGLTTGCMWERLFRDAEAKLKKGEPVDLSFADFYIIGGSGTTKEKLAWMNDILHRCGAKSDMIVGYGSSEFFGVATVDNYRHPDDKKDKKDIIESGMPIAGATVGIFDEDGNELPYNTRGEIWLKGPSLMEGYFGKEELTKSVMQDGWFKTGDIGEMDENGYLFVYGRKKDSIMMNGQRFYLFDIARELKKKFNLDDCMAERKKLSDGSDSVVIYFVQNPKGELLSNQEIITKMQEYTQQYGVTIAGYAEYDTAFPISPTTLKPQSRVMNGFVNYSSDGTGYEIYYTNTDEDDVLDMHSKKLEKPITLVRKR